jgi:DNA polymerase III subunit delta'
MSFKDIRGQDKPIDIIKDYIEQSHLAGGYLFLGSEGVGKKAVAKTVAKIVNCPEGSLDASAALSINAKRPSTSLGTSPEPLDLARDGSRDGELVEPFIEGRSRTIDSCDKCVSCIRIGNNLHPDVHIIESVDTEINSVRNTAYINSNTMASNGIKIEDIRRLQREISLKPYEGKHKVFIIDNAHKLTPEAQNALLKTLEEPPAGSLIILITDKRPLLFKTIISRCKILKFSPLERAGLKDILKKDYGLSNETAHFLAYFSEGRIGLALRLKDTDFMKEKNNIIDKFSLSRKTFSLGGLSIQNKEEVRRYLNILASWFRDIYLIKTGVTRSEIINLDRENDLLAVMGRFSFPDLNEIFEYISDSFSYLEQNINVKLLLYNLGGQLWRV